MPPTFNRRPTIQKLFESQGHQNKVAVGLKAGQVTIPSRILTRRVRGQRKSGQFELTDTGVKSGSTRAIIFTFLTLWMRSPQTQPDYFEFLPEHLSVNNLMLALGDNPNRDTHRRGSSRLGSQLEQPGLMFPLFIRTDEQVEDIYDLEFRAEYPTQMLRPESLQIQPMPRNLHLRDSEPVHPNIYPADFTDQMQEVGQIIDETNTSGNGFRLVREREFVSNLFVNTLVELGQSFGGLSKSELKLLRQCTSKSKPKTETECVICQLQFKKCRALTTLECSHMYHWKCISKWLAKEPRCPMCRRDVRKMLPSRK